MSAADRSCTKVALYGTLTGEAPVEAPPEPAADDAGEGARIVELPRRAERERRARRS